MPEKEVILRLPHASISEADREFFGLEQDAPLEVQWPDECAFTGEEARAALPLLAQKKRSTVRFSVPVSSETAALAARDYTWISSAGLWLSYAGVIGFFIILFFTFSLSEGGKIDKTQLFFWGLVCAAVSFGGFYFVRLMQQFNPRYRRWSYLPGVRAKILQTAPYFIDVRFRFMREEYYQRFAGLNSQLLREKLRTAARDHLEKAQAAVSDDKADPYFALGLAHERSGNAEKAIEAFDEALTRNRQLYKAAKHKGANLLWLNRLQLAESELKQYLKFKPDDVEAMMMLASARELRKKPKEAMELYQQAMELSDDPAIAERAGDLAYFSGSYQQAADYFRQGLQQEPRAFLLHAKLLETLHKAGDAAGVETALQNAREKLPDKYEEFSRRYGAAGAKKHLQSEG